MKLLAPWFCLIATATASVSHAMDGLEAYRRGHYFQAASALPGQLTKDPVANYYMGRMHLYGFGELKNNDLAMQAFNKAASGGFLPAQKMLANYYLLSAKDPKEALNWFKKAAAAGDIQAQLYCTAAYLYGYGISKNSDAARRFTIDAAKNGNNIAQYALGMQFLDSRDSRNKKLGLIWLTKSAEQDNPKAQLQLGKMYSVGTVVAKDLTKGQALMEQAASQNYAPAMLALGDLAIKQGQVETAKTWFNKAIENGSKEAKLALDGLAQPTSLEPSKKQAQKEATVTEDVDPRIAVARWLNNDKSDTFEAAGYALGGIFDAWQNPQALQQNNYNQAPKMDTVRRKALYQPNFAMIKPNEVPINEYYDMLAPTLAGSQADNWSFPRYNIDKQFESLLRHHSMVLRHQKGSAVVDDGASYLDDESTDSSDYLAKFSSDWQYKVNMQAVLNQLYGQAILGESEAQFEIGQLYHYGIGVHKNIKQAITYYELAASQGEVRAEYNLGLVYLEGLTDPVDYQKGVTWMTDAAFKGNAYAQYVLANIYEKGLSDQWGVFTIKPNHEQAMAMYYLASVNHFGAAEYRLADFLVRENNANLSVVAKQNRTKLIKRLYQSAVHEGVAEAGLPLAFYNAMDSDPAKQAQAFATAKQEASAGNQGAALLLGIMYDRGIAVNVSPVDALYWYQQAAQSPVQSFILGTYYSLGQGLGKSADKGQALLEQAAKAGFSYANLNLAVLKHDENAPFLDYLNLAKQQGNSKATILLADYYLAQADNPENMGVAREIYQYLADKGDKEGQLKLGFLYERGLGGVANFEQAAEWYTRAAEQGQPVAQYLLGQLYQTGRVGRAPDYAAAKKWYQSAKAQFIPAAVALGFVYDTVDDDYLHASENYQLAAQANDSNGQFNLGLVYEDGKGMPVDFTKAKELYTQAAEKNHSQAMARLAGLYFREHNQQQAMNWYQKAAALGEESSQYQLGLFSETGITGELSFTEAVKYYQMSAGRGNEKAKMALARMYQYGIGVSRDIKHAADLYRELANNNNAFAQYQLALIYSDGLLGERLPAEAKKLLEQAQANGNAQANIALNRMQALKEGKSSFIEPSGITRLQETAEQTAESMYFDAISQWNRGDETASRQILDRLRVKYPQYLPAKRAYEQLHQQQVVAEN